VVGGTVLEPSMCVSIDGNDSQKRFARPHDEEGPVFYSPFILSPSVVDSQVRVTGKDGKAVSVSEGSCVPLFQSF
jgi:hypothetical protein